MVAQKRKKIGWLLTFLNVYQTKTQLIKILNFLDSSKLYGTLLVNLKSGSCRKLFLAENDFKTCFVELLMLFIVLQTFRFKLFLENSLWSNI